MLVLHKNGKLDAIYFQKQGPPEWQTKIPERLCGMGGQWTSSSQEKPKQTVWTNNPEEEIKFILNFKI